VATYDRNMVLAAYRAEHPDNLTPKPSTLDAFEENMREMYEELLQEKAPEHGIDPNKFNRSMLVIFAMQSSASKASTRVGHACTYFLAVKPVP